MINKSYNCCCSPPLHTTLATHLRTWSRHTRSRAHPKAIRICAEAVLAGVARYLLHGHATDTLRLGDRAVLVCEKQRLKADYLFTQLGDGSGECIILCAEDFDLLLQVGKPLLFALATLQSSDSVIC